MLNNARQLGTKLFFYVRLGVFLAGFLSLKRNFIYRYQIRQIFQEIQILEKLFKRSFGAERNTGFRNGVLFR